MALTDMAVFWKFSTSMAAAEGFALFPAVVLGAFFAAGFIAFATALTAASFTAMTMGEVVGLDIAKGIKTSSGHKRRTKQHSISSQQTCACRVEKFKDQRGKTAKIKASTATANGYLFFFGKLVGRTFGMQSLREIGRLMKSSLQ